MTYMHAQGKMVPEPRVGHTITCKGSEVFVFGGGDSVTVFGVSA
jgi:hypothetical protein